MILSMAQCECGSQKTFFSFNWPSYLVQFGLKQFSFCRVYKLCIWGFTSNYFICLIMITLCFILVVVYLAIDGFILNYPCFFNYSHHPKIDGVIESCLHFSETKLNITILLKFPCEKVSSNLEKKRWDHIWNKVYPNFGIIWEVNWINTFLFGNSRIFGQPKWESTLSTLWQREYILFPFQG